MTDDQQTGDEGDDEAAEQSQYDETETNQYGGGTGEIDAVEQTERVEEGSDDEDESS